MKNKISLLVSGVALSALMACSSLEVSNPDVENYPDGWSVAAYMAANPDLRSLQIMDQVAIRNTESGLKTNDESFLADTTLMTTIALNYAGFTSTSLDFTDKSKMTYLKKFDIYGVENEPAVFETMVLDTTALAMQYISYGQREGRPFRLCGEAESNLILKGDCQATVGGDKGDQLYFDAHLYCRKGAEVYCINCSATDVCPVVAAPASSSSEAAAPAAPESSASEEPAPAEP